jgi:pimeloyl-ACP methyl ester carboxylesterase
MIVQCIASVIPIHRIYGKARAIGWYRAHSCATLVVMTEIAPSLIDRGFVRLAEGLIHYRTVGAPGDQPPLVMLHASPSSSRSLEGLAHPLAPHRQVLMPDTPGNGGSCAPSQPKPTLADYAEMIARFCDTLGVDQIDLYGTHTGAHIAIEWAIAQPQRIRRLIFDGVALLSEADRLEFLERYAPLRAPDAAGTQFPWAFNLIRDQMIFWPHYRQDAAHIRQGGQFDPALLHGLTMDLLGALATYHQPYEAVFRHDPLARLPLIRTPTLWLQGGNSPLDANAERAIASLGDVTVAKADDLSAIASAINQFLNGGPEA